jgi:hypothetical protein
VIVGVVPRRYWRRLDVHVPIFRATVPSALLYLLISASVGVPGFLRHAEQNAQRAVDTMLQATGWRATPGGAPPGESVAVGAWTASFFSVFTFLLSTPLGALTMYLWLSGVYRAVSAAVDDPRGDPLLSIIDAWARRIWQKRAARRRTHARAQREGPEVPDRLLRGPMPAFPDAAYVVVASRRKPEWAPGVFVLTPDAWYKVGVPVERDTPSGLRTLYPLIEVRAMEVLRHGVPYELPKETEELG